MEWNAMSKFINSLRAGAQTQAEATMMKDTGEIVHNCAKHVEHAEWGPGATLAEEHAAPDAAGNIAWYDIMFEHGLERQVPTASLNILVSEAHVHAKKKMTAEGMEDFAKSQAKKRAAARKEKELAALGHPKDKVTHKDVLIGRGVLAKEEVEELDELSKKTLSSYMSKADAEKSTHMDASVRAKRLANNVGAMKDINVGNPEHAAAMRKAAIDYQGSLSKDAERHDATWKKRSAGIKTAMGKYYAKEEVEELDEASIKLFMGFYQVWHKGKKVGSYASRSDAQDHARSLKEEVEQLDERDSYQTHKDNALAAKKSGDQLGYHKHMHAYYKNHAEDAYHDSYHAGGAGNYPKNMTQAKLHSDKMKKLVKEAVEELDEISDITKASYIKKSTDDLRRHRENSKSAMKDYEDRGGQGGGYDRAERHDAKAEKRAAGIRTAVNKLTKEAVEELDELSKKTLNAYTSAARTAVVKHMNDYTNSSVHHGDVKTGAKHLAKAVNRSVGLRRATDKITKEEVEELDELNKSTLASYAKKATDDAALRARFDNRDQPSVSKKTIQRLHGAKKAIDKLAKEEFTLEDFSLEEIEEFMVSEDFEQLDELSKATLGSYVNKAHDQLRHHSYQLGSRYAKDFGPASDHEAKYKRKENNRTQGMKTAINKLTKEEFTLEDFSLEEIEDFMMSEDFDQLDELSKKTLGSYVDKAKQSVVDTKRAAGQAAHQAFKNEKRSPSAQIKHLNARDALNAAAKKREAGISKANARLANEAVEELDELSKSTLGSYVKKASVDAAHKATEWASGQGAKKLIKSHSRIKNIEKATDKLTNEDLDFTEEVDETIEYKTVSIQVNEADKNYDGYFKAAMKAHGVKHPGELKSTEDKKKFFNKVDAGFKAKNEDVFIEAWMRSDVEERIAAHTKAGNKISDQKHTTKAGQGHHSFVVTEPSGKRTRHIFHGNSRKLETMSAAPKSKLAHEAGEDEDDK